MIDKIPTMAETIEQLDPNKKVPPDPPMSVIVGVIVGSQAPVATAMSDRSTDEESGLGVPSDPPPSENKPQAELETWPHPARPSHCLWCWRAMDDDHLFGSVLLVVAVWVGGLGYWSWFIMDQKCFRTVGPSAIDWFTLPAFLAIAALILASANCTLSGLLGSVPTNPEPPYSQDQRDRQVVIYDTVLICIVWTTFCVLYSTLQDLCRVDDDDDDGGFRSANATDGY